jgi:hypothetical protein
LLRNGLKNDKFCKDINNGQKDTSGILPKAIKFFYICKLRLLGKGKFVAEIIIKIIITPEGLPTEKNKA